MKAVVATTAGATAEHRLSLRLRREARKITAPRRAILRVLQRASGSLTHKEIFQALPADHCDLATVYRSVKVLEQLGLVKRFHFENGTTRFAWLNDRPDAHLHHLVCTECNRIVELEECIVADLEKRLIAQSHFKAVTHRLEFFGVCPTCQK